jgi:four helix bundle protein
MKTLLQVARGLASEVEYRLPLAKDLVFLTADEFHDLEGKVFEVQRMLASLVQRLQSPILARC